jgi:hypothetical protein
MPQAIAFPDLVKYKTPTFNPFGVGSFFFYILPQVSPGAIQIQPLSGLKSYVIVLYFTQSGNAIY